jgi:hypothetical protein
MTSTVAVELSRLATRSVEEKQITGMSAFDTTLQTLRPFWIAGLISAFDY